MRSGNSAYIPMLKIHLTTPRLPKGNVAHGRRSQESTLSRDSLDGARKANIVNAARAAVLWDLQTSHKRTRHIGAFVYLKFLGVNVESRGDDADCGPRWRFVGPTLSTRAG